MVLERTPEAWGNCRGNYISEVFVEKNHPKLRKHYGFRVKPATLNRDGENLSIITEIL